MASSESRKNNREADFVWAFVTVQKRQDNGEWKDAEPGHHGSPKDKCTCLFYGVFATFEHGWCSCIGCISLVL